MPIERTSGRDREKDDSASGWVVLFLNNVPGSPNPKMARLVYRLFEQSRSLCERANIVQVYCILRVLINT